MGGCSRIAPELPPVSASSPARFSIQLQSSPKNLAAQMLDTNRGVHKPSSFLKAGASAAMVTLAHFPNLAFAADAEIQVSPGEPGAVISSAHLRALHRASGRSYLRRHLGWAQSSDSQRRWHPQPVYRRHEADRRAQFALAWGLLRRRLPLARRDRRRSRTRALTTSGSAACRRESTPARPTSSAFTNSCVSAG